MTSVDRNTWGKKGLRSRVLLSRTGRNSFDEKCPEEIPSARQLQRSSSHGNLPSQNSGKRSRHLKTGLRMQLPSFEELGISTHTPRLFRWNVQDGSGNTEDRLQSSSSSEPLNPPTLQSPVAFLGSAPLLTPPDDIDSIKWNTAIAQSHESAGSSRKPSIDVARQAVGSAITEASVPDCEPTTEGNSGSEDQEQRESTTPAPSGRGDLHSDEAIGNFLDQGIGANISAITTPDAQLNGITVISQTLPHPLQDTADSHNAFTTTVQAIQARFDGRRPPYIKITHAVPPQFTLKYLPSSPPSTPSRQGGEDYFSLNVFANAAPVPTYHHFDGSIDRGAPSSPAPIVPPSTVQVALVERYIPPSTAQEHMAFFSASGPSVLIDRLVELSPNGGSLMLIYPTKKGAQTFRSQHLGPLLDNLLRTMVIVNDMSSDLADNLGRMPAVSKMLDFEEMKERVNSLCQWMSRGTSSPSRQPEYTLVYAHAGETPLERAAWSEWFLQQETPRMKAALKSYWQRGQKLPASTDGVIPATLLRDVKICIEEGKYEDGEPRSGIEVGVFVIRRSK